jgi:16S rRNA (cytosine1402-N4)-methyltransferase
MTLAAWEMTEEKVEHVTVLRDEVVAALTPLESGLVVDATLGYGGHSEALLRAMPGISIIAFDRDAEAIRRSQERLAPFGQRIQCVHREFGRLRSWLTENGIQRVDGLVADLGVSSPQIDDGDRGFSFRRSGPLDMRMDRSKGDTAKDLIAMLSQEELADLIFQLGEERHSRRVAACIKQALAAGQLETTADLRRATVKAIGPQRVAGLDPATLTFQALRMAVNHELEELVSLTGSLHELVRPGGTAAIISFHSLEDRVVKRCFQERALWRKHTSKPLLPTAHEQYENPRSRSAKLRVASRTSLMRAPDPLPEGADPWELRT